MFFWSMMKETIIKYSIDEVFYRSLFQNEAYKKQSLHIKTEISKETTHERSVLHWTDFILMLFKDKIS